MSDQNTLEKPVPKYIFIAESLKSEMARGLLSPGDQLPSFNEMIERFNVAKNTIDKAHVILEREGLVRREHGRGIFVEPRKLKKTGTIGFLRAKNYNDFFTDELLASIQRHAGEAKFKVMLIDEFTPITRKNVDGVLFFCSRPTAAALDLPVGMPRVLMLEPAATDTSSVVADDFEGARIATRHLLELGHRRISLMLAADEDPYSQRRLAGYRAALDEFEVNFDERLCFPVSNIQPDANNFLYGEEFMNGWLACGWSKLHSTAVMATNDISAVGTIKVLSANGLQVPRDVSVVGFDGTRLSDLSTPRLTTIKVPLQEIGARAVKLVLEQIQGRVGELEEIVLPVRLKLGESAAPPVGNTASG